MQKRASDRFRAAASEDAGALIYCDNGCRAGGCALHFAREHFFLQEECLSN